MTDILKCRFCSGQAIAVFALSDGCICYPEDREQALCPQHIERATPCGVMAVVEWLDEASCRWMGLHEPNSPRAS